MAKKNRRDQQHLRQKTSRQRAYRGNTPPTEIYKPGFPMNLFMNMKVFVVVGLVIMVGGVIVAAVVAGTGGNTAAEVDLPDITPTATPTEGSTATAEPTADSRQFSAAEDVVDAESTDYTATITTDKGVVEIDLFEDVAPNTVNSFVFLAQEGFFNNLRWHRVVDGFVVQTGDPFSAVDRDEQSQSLVGSGGPGYTTEDEPNELSNTRGTLAMAKSSGATSFGSQFFINLVDNPGLDAGNGRDEFFPFAEVTAGMDVVDQIEQGDVIQSIEITETPKAAS